MFANHVSDKRLVSKKYKDHLQVNFFVFKTSNPIKNRQQFEQTFLEDL